MKNISAKILYHFRNVLGELIEKSRTNFQEIFKEFEKQQLQKDFRIPR